ncbi:trypsin-like peptidase domain-containing protein [Micromonospora sp. NPDC049679]|uniref:S1C family serine protease n=1 Tax=Micromonospora sp. NPDC049679 TaxID=3155920 RepID=UPI0033C75B9B
MSSGYDPRVAQSGAEPDGSRHAADDASPVSPSAAPQAQPGPVAATPAFPSPSHPGASPVSAVPASGPDEPMQGRPGPMPPRMEPPQTAVAPFPAPPQPAPPFGTTPQFLAPPTSAPASVPPAPVTGEAHPGLAAAPASGGAWEPSVGYPRPYTPPPPQVEPLHAATGATGAVAAKRRLAWPGVTALLLVVALGGVAGFQAHQIDRLSDRLSAADRRVAEAQAADDTRLDAVEGRATQLEKQAGDVFNPEAISTAVLPSVFRVSAGQFTGTAFAVGKPATGGGTNLFTNFHVVESVWNGGGREVFIERRDQRFPATIVKVDKVNDVAQLKADGKFTGLVTAGEPVKSGQQIVVVGAPLGLEDTVTTGVVSAFRKSPDGSGTTIQFDAPINPGNSGGPVINGAKQVVGIATAKARDAEGIGLAVPIKTACDEFKVC